MMHTTRSPIHSHHAPRSKCEMLPLTMLRVLPRQLMFAVCIVCAPFCCSALCRCVLYTSRIDTITILLVLLLRKDAISSRQDGIHCGIILDARLAIHSVCIRTQGVRVGYRRSLPQGPIHDDCPLGHRWGTNLVWRTWPQKPSHLKPIAAKDKLAGTHVKNA